MPRLLAFAILMLVGAAVMAVGVALAFLLPPSAAIVIGGVGILLLICYIKANKEPPKPWKVDLVESAFVLAIGILLGGLYRIVS